MEFMWGKYKENGIWRTKFKSKFKLLWKNHDSLYICWGCWNFRIMKWSTNHG
jgi:hypothetical protein